MLFNSLEFLFAFLPIVLILYFLLGFYNKYTLSRIILLIGSLTFYGWYNQKYLLLILSSACFNYFIGMAISKNRNPSNRKLTFICGLLGNIALLGYYKYCDFFISNVNILTGSHFDLLSIALPLGISFFTFQQLAYLTDCYKNGTPDYKFLDYCLFVTFFPYVISGPIVSHKDLIPQLSDEAKYKFNSFNFSKGLYIFFMGLIKKVVVADSFAVLANAGYGTVNSLGFLESWITSISYTIQLYFDFSGYSDMALGIALLFNINIAINFNSPYKALSIQDFWRRWHITLSNFLRDYIYIPLGGNRAGETKTLINLILTFLIGGIWHGASWTFVVWGLLHGLATAIHRIWKKNGNDMPDWAGWLTTILFINFTWVFFRAANLNDAVEILKTMAGLKGFSFSLSQVLTDIYLLPMLGFGFILLLLPNPPQLALNFKTNYKHMAYMVTMLIVGMVFINSITASDFLYFDF